MFTVAQMTKNVNRTAQVGQEDPSSEGLALLARIIAGNILRAKGNKSSRADRSDQEKKKGKQQ